MLSPQSGVLPPWTVPLDATWALPSRSPYPVFQRVRVDEVGQHVAEPERKDVPEEPGDEAAEREEAVGT